MTYKDLLKTIKPEDVSDDYCGGCKGCPGDHIPGGPNVSAACRGIHEEGCAKCWNSEAPANEEKKYINPDELKKKIRELHAEPCTDELIGMPTPIHTITTKIVEEQDEMLRKVIHRIAGNVYEEITVDKNKVFDALSKATAKKVKIQPSYTGATIYMCPTCKKWITSKAVSLDVFPNYCDRCGQKLDYDISKEDTDDE